MTEKELHRSICSYLKIRGVLYNTDLSGIKMTMGQAKQARELRCCNGFPDITVYEPRGQYKALFLEVKKETPFKKDGTLKSNDHLREQAEMLEVLNERGYYAQFAWDFNATVDVIDWYLSL